jgi:hypothetical protein
MYRPQQSSQSNGVDVRVLKDQDHVNWREEGDTIAHYGVLVKFIKDQIGNLDWRKNCGTLREIQNSFKGISASLPPPNAPPAPPPKFPPSSQVSLPPVRALLA